MRHLNLGLFPICIAPQPRAGRQRQGHRQGLTCTCDLFFLDSDPPLSQWAAFISWSAGFIPLGIACLSLPGVGTGHPCPVVPGLMLGQLKYPASCTLLRSSLHCYTCQLPSSLCLPLFPGVSFSQTLPLFLPSCLGPGVSLHACPHT